MSVLDRSALEASPLADLHAIASELSIDGYCRLRRPELIDAILAKQEGVEPPEAQTAEDDEGPAIARRRRGRRGGRARGAAREEHAHEEAAVVEVVELEPEQDEEQLVEGVVELLGNGSGFVRVQPPDPSDDDVYISSAQVKRCELVSGDRITGPKRAPRRSERFASLIRVDTINGRPAAELADSVRFDDLSAEFPSERLMVGPDDPTLKAIDWLTPLGKGSRATIVGEARSGKSQALRGLAAALSRIEGLSLQVVLVGVRPEEISEWSHGKVVPMAALSFAASEDAQNAAVEPVIDQARRLAARGGDAVVLIDTLDGCSPQVARKAMASARKIVDGGSLTVIATATVPIGGETTVIALDHELTSVGRFPAIDVFASGTMRPELLVGEEGAKAIEVMRVEASEIAAE
jgi:transcription termination factor Rho